MKTFFVILSVLVSAPGFAGTKACEKLAADTALEMAEKKVADDCFVRFVQPGKDDSSLINVGIACDHTGSFLYQVQTSAKRNSCTADIIAIEPLKRDL
ncbi:MAG: hypothetical protein ACXWQO_00300 [Bdellovibrionota bacterium]